MKLLSTFFCLLLGFNTCLGQRSLKTLNDSVCIYGKIAPPEKGKNLLFFVNDYVLDRQVSYAARVSSDGKFFAKLFIRNTTDIYWKHKSDTLFGLLISPGDSVGINIDYDKIKFIGKNATNHETFQLMWAKRWQESLKNGDGLGLEPEAYLTWRKAKRDRELEWFERICADPLKLKKENDAANSHTVECPDLMRTWFLKNLDVNYFRDLMAFNWASLNYGLGSPKRLTGKRKRKYDSSFFSTINFEDNEYKVSSIYFSLVNSLSQKFVKWADTVTLQNHFQAKIDTLLSFKERLTSSDFEFLHSLRQSYRQESMIDSVHKQTYYSIMDKCDPEFTEKMIRWSIERLIMETLKIPHEDLKELILCKFFISYLGANLQVDFFYKRIASLLTNEEYLQAMKFEYEKHLKETLPKESNIPVTQLVMKDIDKSGKQLLSEILKHEKGKVVLLDFWATWCGPCRADFKYMQELKNKPELADVGYVYLCSQSTEENWKMLVDKYQIKGQHYFITNRQYSELQQIFSLKAFPTYILVDVNRKKFRHVSVHTERFPRDVLDAKRE